jgi:hypothetical protein
MSGFKMKLSGAAAYKNKHGKMTVGLYGVVVDDAGDVVDANAMVHLSMEGGALPITQDQLAKCGKIKGQPLSTLIGTEVPVREDDTPDKPAGADTWRLSFAPTSDLTLEALL